MNQGILGKIDAQEARMKNPLVLAYIGDTVYDLYIRSSLVKKSRQRVNALNQRASAAVNARAQAQAAAMLEESLSEEEKDILRRGRNAHPGTTAKNMSIADYKKATGLEALIGYHYLCGNYARLETLMQQIIEKFGV